MFYIVIRFSDIYVIQLSFTCGGEVGKVFDFDNLGSEMHRDYKILGLCCSMSKKRKKMSSRREEKKKDRQTDVTQSGK